MSEPGKLKIGDVIYIARGFTKNRTGALLVYDSEGNSVGVITNRCNAQKTAYDTFTDAMDDIFQKQLRPKQFGGVPVEAVVTEIEDFDAKLDRRYFKVQIAQEKFK